MRFSRPVETAGMCLQHIPVHPVGENELLRNEEECFTGLLLFSSHCQTLRRNGGLIIDKVAMKLDETFTKILSHLGVGERRPINQTFQRIKKKKKKSPNLI